MLLEGFLNYYSSDANNANFEKYSEVIKFNNGFIGINKDVNKSVPNKTLLGGVTFDNIAQTKFLGDLFSENFVFSSLDDFLDHEVGADLGAGAWYNIQQNKLSLSRQIFGLVPLFYIHIPNKLTAFSTNLSSLVSNKRLVAYLGNDSSRISTYATFLQDVGLPYSSDTFFTHIKSVLPGNILTITSDGVFSKPYVKFHPSQWQNLHSLGEYGEEFRNLFLKAVQKNIGNSEQLMASHLSGGMDSSSISAVIKLLYPASPLVTIYNKSNTINSDENLFAVHVANAIGSNHHEILQSKEDFYLLSTYIKLYGQPSSTLLSPSFTGSLMQYAKSLGCDIIFDGSDGDSIVGSGLELINYSFEHKHWEQVKILLKKRVTYFSKTNLYPKWSRISFEEKYFLVTQNFLFGRISAKLSSSSPIDFSKFILEISRHFNISYSYFIQRGGMSLIKKLKNGRAILPTSVLKDEYLSIKPIIDFKMSDFLEDGSSSEHLQSIHDVINAQAILSNEQSFVLGDYYKISNRSPFYDKQLFELCMSVPNLIKFGDGIGRAHFREAMKGILPEDVRMRSTKTHVRSSGQTIILRLYKQSEEFLLNSTEVWEYIDRHKFNQQVEILKNEKIPYTQKNNTWFNISRTISLAIWLDWLKNIKMS